MPIPLGLAIAPMAAQTGLGIFQAIKGARDAGKVQRPTYEVPPAMMEALGSIQEQMGQKYMPGEMITRQLEQETMAGAVSQALGSMSSAGDISQAITSVYGQQLRNENERGAMRAEYFDNLNDQERALLREIAGFQDQAFQFNEWSKFQEEAGAASALQGAGIQNLMGALNTTAMMGMSGAFDGMGGGSISPEVRTTTPTTPPVDVSSAITSKSVVNPAPTISFDARLAQSIKDIFTQTIPNYDNIIGNTVGFQMNTGQ